MTGSTIRCKFSEPILEIDETAIDQWAESRRSQVTQTEHLMAELQSVASPNLSMLAVANRQLKSMNT